MDTERIVEIIHHHAGEQGALISILEDVQTTYGYLPAEALRTVAERTGRPLVDVYGVATFYRAFSLKPRGKHLCTVCMGTACHVRGAPTVLEEFEAQLGIRAGETTPDKELTLETVNCLGACALGPVVVADGRYRSGVRTSNVTRIIEDARFGLDKEDIASDRRIFPIAVACSRCNADLMEPAHPIDGAPSIHLTLWWARRYGWLRLSSLYGRHTSACELDVPTGAVVELFCPRCHADLKATSVCPDCQAPMSTLVVRPAGVLRVCPRRGCPGHMLDLS